MYRHFAGEVELDKRAFAYGNIKPDIPSKNRIHHTLENCLFTVCDYSNQLMDEEETSLEAFSVRLGEICHYVCDFFCYYHLNEEVYGEKLHHFMYELKLHHELLRIWLKHKLKLMPSKMEPRRDIYSIVLDMRKVYFSQPGGMKRDIDYAFEASVWTCESIIYFMKYFSDLTEDVKPELYSLLAAEGGNQ